MKYIILILTVALALPATAQTDLRKLDSMLRASYPRYDTVKEYQIMYVDPGEPYMMGSKKNIPTGHVKPEIRIESCIMIQIAETYETIQLPTGGVDAQPIWKPYKILHAGWVQAINAYGSVMNKEFDYKNRWFVLSKKFY